MRRVLAAYAGVPPASLRFQYGPQGKPQLAGVGTGIGFNVSHSGDWVLCAVAPARHVGVDVEKRGTELTAAEVDSVVTQEERDVLANMGGAARSQAALDLWTRKEAIVKAMGLGMSQALERLEVGLKSDLVRTPAHPVAWWRLSDASPEPAYAGAVAVEDGPWRVLRWNGPPAEAPLENGAPPSGNDTFPFRILGRTLRPFGTDIRG